MSRSGAWRTSFVGMVMALAVLAVPAMASAATGPTAIGQDAQGVSYVGFGDSSVIQRFDANGNPLSSWNASPNSTTTAISVDPSGNVWIQSQTNVSEFTASGQQVESFFDGDSCPGDSQSNIPDPSKYGGLAVTSNAIYVASRCFDTLTRFSLSGTQQQQVSLPGQPRGVTVGPAGSRTNQVFVAMPGQHEVLTFDGSTFATNSSEPPLTVNGSGSTNWSPCGIADKNDGGGDELIVADCLNNYLYVYDPSHLYGPGGTYSEYRTLGHGTGSAAGSVNDPGAIALHANDGSGLDSNIFIADYNNNRIQRWNDSGYTFWAAQANSPGTIVGGGGSAPTNSTPPSITGNPVVGTAVTCSTGTWTGSPSGYGYTWLDNGAAISGANSGTYTIQASDVGKSLTCSVIASNSSGNSAAATSAAVVPAANATAPASTAPPSITGQAVQGGTLTCNNGTWTGTAPITYSYVWKRNSSQVSTGQTYTIAAADVGQAVTCTVTASNSAGSASSTSSAVTPTASSSGSGKVGVTINNGALYTNNPAVTVTAVAPSGTTSVILSNDGSFAEGQTFPVSGNSQYAWTLQSSGNERLPKTVYVRFVGSGSAAYLTLTDDIILDQTAPTVQMATLAAATHAVRAERAELARRAVGYVLRVKAKDNASGVAELQYGRSKHANKVTTVKYARSVHVARPAAVRFVRVIDGAGNYGRWHRVARG